MLNKNKHFGNGSPETIIFSINLLPISAQKKMSPEITSKRKLSILIFTADNDLRVLLKTVLSFDDYEVLEAETAEDAIKLTENQKPDLVLMDAVLVIKETFADLRRMKKCGSFETSPFILLSGHAQNEVRQMALAAGAADLLVKPIDFDLLEIVIKHQLQKLLQPSLI